MFGVRVFVAQNICLLYLSISSCILMLCNFFWGGGKFGIFGGETFPPDVPRINPVHSSYSSSTIFFCISRDVYFNVDKITNAFIKNFV